MNYEIYCNNAGNTGYVEILADKRKNRVKWILKKR
jgi:hypothetical protein